VDAISGDGDNSRVWEPVTIVLRNEAYDVSSNVSDTLCIGYLDQNDRREDD
jgi:hypothetical protein